MTMKRRDALKTIGGLASAAGVATLLPGCGDNSGEEGPAGITTYVFLMMENRSYDHALGARALEGLGGDGLDNAKPNPDLDGVMIAPFAAADDRGAATAAVCDPDPPHGWTAAHNSFANGENTGFVVAHQEDHGDNRALVEPMKYLTRVHQPVSWALADEYASCDRWFCSVMGPTLPNRAYWHTGTSFGIDNNDDVISRFANVPVPTIYNRLEEAGVDWCYYYGSLAVVALLGEPGPHQIDLGPNDGTGKIRRFGNSATGKGQFFEDCAAGRLPSVVYIDPAFGTNDDHPPVHPMLGQELISSIYRALATSPQWKNILFVITYDENGGYADHVAPPTTTDDTLDKFGVPGFEQLGFRVPAIVIGPYVKQGHVSSVVYDHTSPLKHLQNVFGLASLNVRVDAANDLTDCLDLDRLARNDPAPPIEVPEIDATEWPIDAQGCIGAGGFKVGDPISDYADRHPEVFAKYDLRADAPHYLAGIREYLRGSKGSPKLPG